MLQRTDGFIIGGGPQGWLPRLRTRARLRRCRRRWAEPPIDKACGEGLLPDAVEVLARLGVEIPSSDRFPLQGIRFLDAELRVDAHFPADRALGSAAPYCTKVWSNAPAESASLCFWKHQCQGFSREE